MNTFLFVTALALTSLSASSTANAADTSQVGGAKIYRCKDGALSLQVYSSGQILIETSEWALVYAAAPGSSGKFVPADPRYADTEFGAAVVYVSPSILSGAKAGSVKLVGGIDNGQYDDCVEK